MARTQPIQRRPPDQHHIEDQSARQKKEKHAYSTTASQSWPLARVPRTWGSEIVEQSSVGNIHRQPGDPETTEIPCAAGRMHDHVCEEQQTCGHGDKIHTGCLGLSTETSSIEKLPREVLEEIIGLALDLGMHNRIAQPPKVWEPHPQEEDGDRKPPPGRRISQNALPLLLSCKVLCDITHYVIFSRVQFYSPHSQRLEWLLEVLSRANQPNRVRHVAIQLDSSSVSPYNGTQPLRSKDEQGVEADMDLLERLSKELQTLALLGPHDDSLEYTNYHKTHPALLRALNTFPGLRHLELEFYDHWLHVSMFCAVPRVSRPWAIDPIWKDSDGVPPPPLFPNLQHLYLNGCLAHWLLPEDLILAFSQQQLPSLKSLVIDRLLYKDDGGTVFVPEVFRRMNRLSEFNWVNYDFETNVTHTKGGPHAPLMREHLDALKERHGETLQLLSLNYTGLNSAYASDGEWILTKEYLTGFIKEMPMLDKIYIDIPIAGVKIQVGKATSDCRSDGTRQISDDSVDWLMMRRIIDFMRNQ